MLKFFWWVLISCCQWKYNILCLSNFVIFGIIHKKLCVFLCLKIQFKSCSSLSSFLCVDTTLVPSLSFMLEWKSSQIVQRKNFTFRKFGELLIKITLKLHESLTPWKQITMKQGVTQWFCSVLYVGSFLTNTVCVFSLGFSTLISMSILFI